MHYKNNIKTNYIFHFFSSFNVTQGVWMLFLVSKGLSLFEVGLLEGIFHITSFLMETPTGAIADVFGRKMSRLIAKVFAILSSVFIILSGGFGGYAFSFVLSALSYNFESGAGEALIYDSLKADKEEGLFKKVSGKNETIFHLAAIMALILGGVFGTIDYYYVYIISIVLSVIALIVGLFFKEPPIENQVVHDKFTDSMKHQYIDTIKVVKENGKLAYLLVFSALIAVMATVSFFYLQVNWKAGGFVEWQIGLILAVSSLTAIVGALLAERIDKKYGEKKLLIIVPFFVGITMFMLYDLYFSIVGFALLSFIESLLYVSMRDYLNVMIPSDKRATILSFESVCFSFLMIVFFPLFGFVADYLPMAVNFVALGSLMLILAMVNYKMLSKIDSNK